MTQEAADSGRLEIFEQWRAAEWRKQAIWWRNRYGSGHDVKRVCEHAKAALKRARRARHSTLNLPS